MENNKLSYSNQLKFKTWAKSKGLSSSLYYFDGEACVNAKTSKNIRGVSCNGKLTWIEALNKLLDYFNKTK